MGHLARDHRGEDTEYNIRRATDGAPSLTLPTDPVMSIWQPAVQINFPRVLIFILHIES